MAGYFRKNGILYENDKDCKTYPDFLIGFAFLLVASICL
jgi:hypothetical protein